MPGGNSRNPAARARSISNLKRANRTGRHGKELPLEAIPGMSEFMAATPRTMHKALTELARANTPGAFRLIVQVMNGSGYKMRDRLFAAQLIIDRGFGRSPMVVGLVGASEPEPAGSRPESRLDSPEYAREVYRILKEVGGISEPGDDHPVPDERDAGQETVVEPAPVDATPSSATPEADNPFPSPRPPLRRPQPGGQITPSRSLPAPSAPPNADDEVIGWLFDALRQGRIGGVSMLSEHYRGQLRPRLLRSSDPAAAEIVAALDPRF